LGEALDATVSSLQTMQSAQAEMKSELLKLPDLIIEQLVPLATLAPDLNRILKVQRESIEQMVVEVESRITQQMQPSIVALEKSVKASVIAMQGLDGRIIAAQTQIDQLAALPGKIVKAKDDLVKAKTALIAETPNTIQLISYMVVVGMVTGLVIYLAQRFLGT